VPLAPLLSDPPHLRRMRLSIDVHALREESARKTGEREAVEVRIATLVREGITIPTIALRVGVSPSTIHRILRKLRSSIEA